MAVGRVDEVGALAVPARRLRADHRAGVNWALFIYAILVGRVLEVSLGYFINPLVNVLFGLWLLCERLSRRRRGAGGRLRPPSVAGRHLRADLGRAGAVQRRWLGAVSP